jgi:hypothetical protein
MLLRNGGINPMVIIVIPKNPIRSCAGIDVRLAVELLVKLILHEIGIYAGKISMRWISYLNGAKGLQ